MIRSSIRALTSTSFIVVCATACGGVVSNSGGQPDGSTDAHQQRDVGTELSDVDINKDAGSRDATSDTASDGPSPDAATCGSLGETCCGGTTCVGSLICSTGRCSCQSNFECPDDGTCNPSGQCMVTVSGGSAQFNTDSIALDGVSVYWANGGSGAYGSVVKAPLGGGAPETLVSSLTMPLSLVQGGGLLYWYESQPTEGIVHQPINGGAVGTVIAGPSIAAANLVIDSADVYWTYNAVVDGTVQKMALSGGEPSTLVTGLRSPSFLALGASDLYWTDQNGLHMVSKAGGKPGTLAGACADPPNCTCAEAPLVLDSANVYCLDLLHGVLKVALSGGTVTTLASVGNEMSYPGGILPEEIAIDEEAVYWVSNDGLMSVPKAGGATTTLSTQGGTAIAVNSTSVYWATGTSDGKIVMLSPK
jgi:hypothetical protein